METALARVRHVAGLEAVAIDVEVDFEATSETLRIAELTIPASSVGGCQVGRAPEPDEPESSGKKWAKRLGATTTPVLLAKGVKAVRDARHLPVTILVDG